MNLKVEIVKFWFLHALKEKVHTVPHMKALIIGFEVFVWHGNGSTFQNK